MFDGSYTLDTKTGAALHVHHARATVPARAIVLVHHGLSEHAGRYGAFAAALAAANVP